MGLTVFRDADHCPSALICTPRRPPPREKRLSREDLPLPRREAFVVRVVDQGGDF